MTEFQETALIQVRPDGNPQINALYAEGDKLLQFARARVITTIEDAKVATEDLSIIAGFKRRLEEKRKEYVSPINEHVNAINAAFKNFLEPFLQADSITRQKVQAYRAEQERVRLAEEEINRLRTEAAQKEMELKGELTEPVSLVPVSEAPANAYHGALGTLGTARIKKWEVIDLNLVPIEYMMIDAAKVGRVVRAGIPSIPGIRIWEEEVLRITPR